MVTTLVASKLGDDSLFDSQPINDYVKPTKQTTEQVKLAANLPLRGITGQEWAGVEAKF